MPIVIPGVPREDIIRLPADGENTGKPMRANQVSVGGPADPEYQEVVSIADEVGNDLSGYIGNLDVKLSALRDSIAGVAAVAKSLADVVNALQATQPRSISNFPATQPVSGAVSVSNFPGTQSVSGTFWQATQPVSGLTTDDTTESASLRELRAIRQCLVLLLADQGITPHVASLLQEDAA